MSISQSQLKKYYDYLVRREPIITSYMQQLIITSNAHGIDVYLIGEENRIKSFKSYINKCNRSDRIFPPIFYTYDVLRYTLILPVISFKELYLQIVNELKKTFTLYRVKNTWIKFDKDIPYRGINTIFANEKGILFEVQFHTIDSYNANIETHKLYEMLLYGLNSCREKNLIKNAMLSYVNVLDTPMGAYSIFDYDNSKELLKLITRSIKTL